MSRTYLLLEERNKKILRALGLSNIRYSLLMDGRKKLSLEQITKKLTRILGSEEAMKEAEGLINKSYGIHGYCLEKLIDKKGNEKYKLCRCFDPCF